jgi:hypothetical protein
MYQMSPDVWHIPDVSKIVLKSLFSNMADPNIFEDSKHLEYSTKQKQEKKDKLSCPCCLHPVEHHLQDHDLHVHRLHDHHLHVLFLGCHHRVPLLLYLAILLMFHL